jgi:hypothetical protein
MPEMIALAIAGLVLVLAIGAYLLQLRPQSQRLEAMTAERAQLETQLRDMRTSVQTNQTAQSSAQTIVESLVNFETDHLGDALNGSTRVIEELNKLIRKNGLRISGGLAFTQLEETAPGEPRKQQQRSGEQNVARVVESIFPGVAITLTVEGTYPSLRRFVRDVEADRQQFIVVNSVELEGIADSANSGSAATESSGTVTPGSSGEEGVVTVRPPTASGPSNARGTLVSLRLDMAAYFRRARARMNETEPAPSAPIDSSVR